jgi:ribosomal protein S18 acetylase RimI-like enzyme
MIRPLIPADLPALRAVIAANDLFPPEMLDDMAAPFLTDAEDAGFWLTDEADGPVGLAYCVPERLTSGTWNLLLIAVHPDRQGQGRGTALMQAVEAALAARGARILLVETSGLPDYARSRAFYRRLGFGEEARIRDFYRAGDDKVVFRKALGA